MYKGRDLESRHRRFSCACDIFCMLQHTCLNSSSGTAAVACFRQSDKEIAFGMPWLLCCPSVDYHPSLQTIHIFTSAPSLMARCFLLADALHRRWQKIKEGSAAEAIEFVETFIMPRLA